MPEIYLPIMMAEVKFDPVGDMLVGPLHNKVTVLSMHDHSGALLYWLHYTPSGHPCLPKWLVSAPLVRPSFVAFNAPPSAAKWDATVYVYRPEGVWRGGTGVGNGFGRLDGPYTVLDMAPDGYLDRSAGVVQVSKGVTLHVEDGDLH